MTIKSTKRLCSFALAVMSATFALTGSAATEPVQMNGVDWYNYLPNELEGTAHYDKLPDASGTTSPLWNRSGGQGTATIIDDFLRIDTSAAPTGTRQYRTSTGWDQAAAGMTFETRLRITESAGGSPASIILGTEGGRFQLQLTTNELSFMRSSGNGGRITYAHDFTEWTVLRVTLERISSDPEVKDYNLSLYVDGDSTPVLTSSTFFLPADAYGIIFGDTSSTTDLSGVSDWNYVYWTSEGAFAPVIPESGHFAIGIGLMALAFGLYRRHRSRR